MVPDHLSTALEFVAQLKYLRNNLLGNGVRARAWSACQCGNVPCATVQVVHSTVDSVGAVGVVELNMFVELGPLAFPAPQGTPVDTAAIRYSLQRQLLNNEQLHCQGSRLGQVRIGRIGHSRLLSV